jgi:plasmid stabilization system protein ParE
MSLRLVVEPEVEAEVAAVEAWYREQSLIASERFLQAVKRSLLLIAENPLQYQTVFGRYRKAMVRPFPYALIYTTTDTEIVVVACTHGRRHPRRWQDRIRG